MSNKLRSVLSFRVARELIARGFHVVDFATSRKYSGKVVVKFEASREFDEAFSDIMRRIKGEDNSASTSNVHGAPR
ncbi:hypothetical protein ACLIBH_04965 [Virgibacillus sp. W0430]|uniref:hypothetical protein n=1 Tax=Virgibacillus sp. W0430 TaxID=3391580 RepID=UPI003F45E614